MSTEIDALLPILRNAEDLIFEAELLLNAGRFARSTALSVVAIEEIGKFVSRRLDLAGKQVNFHKHKQYAAEVFIGAGESYRIISKWLEENGYELRHRTDLTESQDAWLQENGSVGWEALRHGVQQEMAEFYASNSQLFDEVCGIRNGCLYVDLTADGKPKQSPASITVDSAEKSLELAKRIHAEVLLTYPEIEGKPKTD